MTLKNLPLCILIASLIWGTPSVAQWNHVGAAGFSGGAVSYTSLAINRGDTLFAAFRDDYTSNGGKATVMYFGRNSASWTPLGNTGFSTNPIVETSIATDSATGDVYLAYIDSLTFINVVKFDGNNTWTSLGSNLVPSNNQSSNIKLLVAGDGTLYLGYNDNNQSYKANMIKYSGGTWTQVGSTNFSNTDDTYFDFAVDHYGTPYAASEASDFPENIQVQKFDGSNWVDVGSTTFDTASFATGISLAIGPNNTPYVAASYHDGHHEAKVWSYNGANWLLVGGQPATSVDAEEVKIAISKTGVPVLSYIDYSTGDNKASVKFFNGTSWNFLGNQAFTGAEADYSSLAINSTGDVYLTYEDYANGKGATTDVYLHSTGIHDAAGIAGFTVYPNPSSGKFQVSFKPVQSGDVQLSITNMMGQKVWEDTRTASNGMETIDLSHVAKGLYTLQVRTNSGMENRLVEIR